MKNKKTNQPEGSTKYAGVFPAKTKSGNIYFRSSLTWHRKHISLGSYPTEALAHQAYLEGQRLLSSPQIDLSSYSSASPLPFEKWVCLINYRDNDIYLGTPIYIGQRLFYYYLSPCQILKFDMDDLFYYSSHKIMQRGGHYFVADYGMQVSLPSRYGIKNYAVEGIDYRFINGDKTDFRRENIEILNIYHGVRLSQKNGQSVYTVRIHIKGNYLVGRYTSDYEAAIAYNKAIDILQKKGVQKNYTPNYIEGLSPRKYAEIYSNIQISPKILHYHFSE